MKHTKFEFLCLFGIFLIQATSLHAFVNNNQQVTAESSTRLFEDSSSSSSFSSSSSKSNELTSRRKVIGGIALVSAGFLSGSSSAVAFDRTFPDELTEGDKNSNNNIVLGSRTNSQQRTTAAVAKDQARKQNLINPFSKEDLAPSFIWGGALWLLSGSRSNPLTKVIANIIYDKEEDEFVKDLNDGLFAAPPVELLLLLGAVFTVFGFITQFLALQLAEGDTTVCFQLAGVSLIWGGFFEIGRLASGDKRMTREEKDRNVQLKMEFNEFAEKRLQPGGNCHKSDVIGAFRRFYAKYRDADSSEFPLTDLEIERLLRLWNQIENKGQAEMTSSGFYYGFTINTEADVFVSRM